MIKQILSKNSKLIYKILNISFMLALFGFFLFFVLNANRGFDITDESYSILWAKQPENVSSWINPFGFITKYIWLFSGENIGFFRIFSVVILFLTGLVFAISLDYFWSKKHHQASNNSLKIIPIAALTVTSLIYFHRWQLFISYNLLTLVSCLLVISGLFLGYGQNKNRIFIMITGGVIVGFGVFIAFLSKPTTSILLAIIVLAWITFYHQNSKKNYFIGAAGMTALIPFLMFIYLKLGGIGEFYTNFSNGIHLIELAQTGHDLRSLILKIYISYRPLILTPAYYFFHAPVFILLLALLFSQSSKEYYKKNREKIVIFLTFFFLLSIVFSMKESHLNNNKELLTFFTFSTISLFLSVLTFSRLDKVNKDQIVNIDAYKIVVLSLFALLFAYAFGTRTLMSIRQFGALIFIFAIWIYSFKILLMRYEQKKYIIVMLSLLMFIMTAKLIETAYIKPNRLISNIALQDIDVEFHGVNGVLKVDKTTAKYVNDLKDIAFRFGWKEQNLLIDLTGATPGALVILNAKIVGSPWLVGGYPGSANYIKAYIKQSGENPFDSWILTAPYGKRSVPVSVLSDDDYNFEEKYQLVGSFRTGHRNELQFLWKPKN